ncbi:hypothetical protein IQ241_20665 [Romeria aff. gracilis LEGE 07310]|uniref:Uncharacterized protein n=1 Tax=Vasconcelosia minhoensis LEGE 07310 TaxID=915328 RepID=A0A8J7AB63_9CYAN|nr:hypothetical protein [Romeria gracilis]MBE9079675.1 hypothetical protein [Romeria aff. gracilis LEGE 07310]
MNHVKGTYRRFNLVFLGLGIPGLLSIGAFNIFIDPYGVLSSPEVTGVNHSKPEKTDRARMFKAADVVRIQPKTVFLGNSRAEIGLDPNHPALADGRPVYNLGLPSSNIYEARRYLEHAIANQPDMERAIVGLDFAMFNDHWQQPTTDFSDSRLEKTRLPVDESVSAALSLDATQSSLQTFIASLEDASDPRVAPGDTQNYYIEGGVLKRKLPAEQSMLKRFQTNLRNYLEWSYRRYELSESGLDDLRQIIALGQQHDIEIQVFISPVHAVQLEAIRASGLWSDYETWKREIAEITPVWDFSGYNSITSEAVDQITDNYLESAHYLHPVGDLVLNRILDYEAETVPDDFGVLLTPETVEPHIEQIRRDREAWVAIHPEQVDWVQKMARRLRD